jgi:MFS family permease
MTPATLIIEDAPSSTVDDVEDVPEGGYGWLVVAGVSMVSFLTFGYNAAWGVFQDHYYSAVFLETVPLTTLSLIGSTFLSVMLVSGLFLRRPIVRYGPRTVLATGGVLMVAGFVSSAFCTAAWQLVLCQGVLLGVGAGMLYYPSIGLISQYFRARLALAMGFATCGSGLGGFVLAPLARALIDQLGVRSTLLIFGGMYLVLGAFVVAVCKPRIQLRDATEQEKEQAKSQHVLVRLLGKVVNLAVLRRRDVQVLVLITNIGAFAYAAPFYFFPSYAQSIGLSATEAAWILGGMSLVNALGRILFGQLAGMYGSTNLFFIATFLSGVLCIVMWPFATSMATLIAFACLFGCTSGGYISLNTAVTAQSADHHTMSDTMGIVFSMEMIGNLCGSTVFAALLNASNGSYLYSQLFCALSYLLASVFIIWLRLLRSHTFWKAV